MTSPFRSSDRSSSSPRSTPLRSLQNGNPRANGYHHSLRDNVNESPSQQLLEEFGRMLINDHRAFKRSLDEQTAAQQKLHVEALDRSLAKHKEVRESAERVRERVELEIERERSRRDYEERKAVEKARRELEEQRLQEEKLQLEANRAKEEERRAREALEREEAERKRNVEAQRQRETEESQRAEAERKQEAARKAAQEQSERTQAENKSRDIQQSQASPVQSQSPTATRQASTPAAQPNGVKSHPQAAPPPSQAQSTPTQPSQPAPNVPKGIVSSHEERLYVHRQYLDLHQRLKQMREQVSQEVTKVPGLKNQMSDWRRAIQKCCGQLAKATTDAVKQSNSRATQEIVAHLDAAATIAEPSIDVTQYLIQNKQPPNANKQGPAVLVFLLNHFAKKIISQFISESAVDPKSADHLGVLAVTVFARPHYLFNGQSLIDLLWAKYHKVCPILFGISGNERNTVGRSSIGWPVENGGFVREQEHYDRATGLGAGFAAITLRSFGKSKNSNPAPNRIYWESIARILNTPANETQPTHFIVLKAMINDSVPRIINIFGVAGLAVIRQALITFPNERGPQDEKGNKIPAVKALQAMPQLLERDLALTL